MNDSTKHPRSENERRDEPHGHLAGGRFLKAGCRARASGVSQLDKSDLPNPLGFCLSGFQLIQLLGS